MQSSARAREWAPEVVTESAAGSPSTCVHTMVRAAGRAYAKRSGSRVRRSTWSYLVLNQKANRLAHHLRSIGINSETLVGLCLGRSLEMIAARVWRVEGGCRLCSDRPFVSTRVALVSMRRKALFPCWWAIKLAAKIFDSGTLRLWRSSSWMSWNVERLHPHPIFRRALIQKILHT